MNDRFPADVVIASVFQRVDSVRLPLVNRFYTNCNYNVKCGRQDHVFSLSHNGEIIAAARLISHPQGHFLLRNLCVYPEVRNQGVATCMLKQILAALAGQYTPLHCYCYALPHLLNFYLTLGFKQLIVEQVPSDIAETHLRNCARKRGWILMGYCNNLSNDYHKEN